MDNLKLADGTTAALLKGFTAYGIEKQNGLAERHLPPGHKPWQEVRVEWMEHILHCAAKYEGLVVDEIVGQFEKRLDEAAKFTAVELSSLSDQQSTLQALRGYISVLEHAEGDHRLQLLDVRELLSDMVLDRLWGGRDRGLFRALEDVDTALVQVTARQPIRFTRILLGPETGPCKSGFVSGSVTTPQAVRATEFYQRFCEQRPERRSWPALCVTYAGCGGRFLRDANELDLSIIRKSGDRFVEQFGVRNLDFGHKMVVRPEPEMKMNLTM